MTRLGLLIHCISSEIKLELEPSRINIFLKIIFHHFLSVFPISLKFRVDPMIYFGSLKHYKQIKKNIGAKIKQNGGQNQEFYHQLEFYIAQ
jgi:hypothetical protein